MFTLQDAISDSPIVPKSDSLKLNCTSLLRKQFLTGTCNSSDIFWFKWVFKAICNKTAAYSEQRCNRKMVDMYPRKESLCKTSSILYQDKTKKGLALKEEAGELETTGYYIVLFLFVIHLKGTKYVAQSGKFTSSDYYGKLFYYFLCERYIAYQIYYIRLNY